MKENFINRLQNLIGESNLQFKRWDTLINLYVLPKIAGTNERKYISDDFLNLVADYGSEICAKDSYITEAILEICLQRLSNGAIPANISISMDNLPDEYKKYSSALDKPYPMTGGCLNFLMNGLELAFYSAKTRNHATMILFSFVEQISPTGKIKNKENLGEYAGYSAGMFAHAEKLLEKHLSFEELYVHYAQPDQWEKHIDWFKNNQHLLNWEQFFKDINVAQEGSKFYRWQTKRRIKKFILR